MIIDAHDWVPRADSFYDKTRGGWGGQKPHTGPALCSSISHIVLKHLVIFSLSSEYTGTKTLRWNSRMRQMSQQEPNVPITEKKPLKAEKGIHISFVSQTITGVPDPWYLLFNCCVSWEGSVHVNSLISKSSFLIQVPCPALICRIPSCPQSQKNWLTECLH